MMAGKQPYKLGHKGPPVPKPNVGAGTKKCIGFRCKIMVILNIYRTENGLVDLCLEGPDALNFASMKSAGE